MFLADIFCYHLPLQSWACRPLDKNKYCWLQVRVRPIRNGWFRIESCFLDTEKVAVWITCQGVERLFYLSRSKDLRLVSVYPRPVILDETPNWFLAIWKRWMHSSGVHISGVHIGGVHSSGVHISRMHSSGTDGVHYSGVHIGGVRQSYNILWVNLEQHIWYYSKI